MGGRLPEYGGPRRWGRHVQAYKRGAFRVAHPRAGVRGQHADGHPILHQYLCHNGSVLRRHVHDDGLGTQQTLARFPRQRLSRHGNRLGVWAMLLSRRRFYRHQPCRSFPHDR